MKTCCDEPADELADTTISTSSDTAELLETVRVATDGLAESTENVPLQQNTAAALAGAACTVLKQTAMTRKRTPSTAYAFDFLRLASSITPLTSFHKASRRPSSE
ncbi:MAG: hypothetical protein WAZ21_01625 [Candidatus Saccharimonadales bacterium]